jgi:tetratricopeptide (TPR) repeat protein
MDREIDPGNFGILNNPLAATEDSSLRWGSSFALQLTFLSKILLGRPLIHDYSFNLIELTKLSSIKSIGGIVVFGGMIYLSILGLLKKNKWGIIASIYLLSIAIASQILMPIGTIFAERLLFMSVLPFAIFVAFLYHLIQPKIKLETAKAQKAILVIGIISVAAYLPQTFSRNSDWENNYSLYEADIEKGANSARINYNFGTESYEQSSFNQQQAPQLLNQAITYLNKAIKIYPEYYDAYNNLGLVYRETKDFNRGINLIKTAIALNPDYKKYYLNLGLLYYDSKQYQFAIKSFDAYVFRNPQSYETYLLLGQACGNLNQFEKAIGYLNQAIALKPDYLEAYNFLGMAYGFTNQQTKAENTLKNALRYYPNDSQLLFNLSISLHQQNKYQEEFQILQQIIAKYPNNTAAKRNLELVKELL